MLALVLSGLLLVLLFRLGALPMLALGLMVMAVNAMTRRGPLWPAMVALGMTVAAGRLLASALAHDLVREWQGLPQWRGSWTRDDPQRGHTPFMATSQQGSLTNVQPTWLPGQREHSVRSGWARRAFDWLPGVLTLGFTAAVLNRYGVSVSDMAFYSAYLVLCVALPGLLLIRALYGGTRTLAEELALGLALGLAVELAVYIPARAAGSPLLVLVWPIATYIIFLAVPRLRTHWKAGPRSSSPLWWPWALALIVCYLVAESAYKHFGAEPLTWPALAQSSPVDTSYHLGLIGELKHHVPPMNPAVAGEPLLYHWFVYAHWAAASWISGVEPMVLLLRLGVLPMLAAFVVLVAMLARRVIGSWMGAVLAVVVTLGLGAPRLFLGSFAAFTWGGIRDAAWTSPTFTFGSLLLVPIVLISVDLLGRRRNDLAVWLLLGVFLMAVMGAKATCLPMLVVGLAMVTAVTWWKRRQLLWPALAALGMTIACLLFAQFVLFGGARQGMLIAPFSYMGTIWHDLTGTSVDIQPPLMSLFGVAAVYLLAWAVTWSPVLGLLSRPWLLIRSDVVLMLGIAAAGLGAVVMFDHPGRSHLYFLWGSFPYLAIIAVFGAFVMLRQARVPLRVTLCAIGAGLVGAYAIPVLWGLRPPLDPGQLDTVYVPYVALVVVIALGATAVVATRSGLRGWALVISAVAAIGLPAAYHVRVFTFLSRGGEETSASAAQASAIPQGVLAAARWIRAHSAPDDLVATNVHCRWGYENPCDGRQFWSSALTERHMLVEGWTYTVKNVESWKPGQLARNQPFWDPERLEANEAAFQSPSPGTIQRLRVQYGVRWLLVDERRLPPGSRLGEFAELQYRAGDYAAYRLPASDRIAVPQPGSAA
ncbi:hypothetical protein [Nonomuraea sp. CA-141351]|uniref:hypothetical protein n=1 Tax=Nonomuraea sp. CA-141351 TaxID=3239996 RepID=UPI003D944359